jgi:hypothetical protein
MALTLWLVLHASQPIGDPYREVPIPCCRYPVADTLPTGQCREPVVNNSKEVAPGGPYPISFPGSGFTRAGR